MDGWNDGQRSHRKGGLLQTVPRNFPQLHGAQVAAGVGQGGAAGIALGPFPVMAMTGLKANTWTCNFTAAEFHFTWVLDSEVTT